MYKRQIYNCTYEPAYTIEKICDAMQIAALNTPYLNESEVPAEIIEHEKEVMRQPVINEGKPEQIADKIVMGKIGKFYKENCLLDQEFVKDNKINIKQYTHCLLYTSF